MDITRYIIEDADGNEIAGVWEEWEYQAARNAAAERKGKLVALYFTFSDSELIEDFTEDEGNTDC